MDMGRGRPRTEESRARSIRLPERIWNLLESAKEYPNINEQILRLVEDFLVKKGRMTDKDRKPPIRRKTDRN